MKSIEMTGKTVEDAVKAGLRELGCDSSDVTIDVLHMGSPGLFGMFGKLAKVRLTVKEEDPSLDIDFSDLSLSLGKSSRPAKAKPEVKVETKAEAKPEVKVEAKPEAQVEAKVEAKPEVKIETKPEVKAEMKSEAKVEAAAEVVPEVKAEVKVEEKSEAKAEEKTERREKPRRRDNTRRNDRSEKTEKAEKAEKAEKTENREKVEKAKKPAEPFEASDPETLSEAGKAAYDFLKNVTEKMGVSVAIRVKEEEDHLSVAMMGDTLGILIGRRGDTLDALQYLTSLQVNKHRDGYMRVSLDTENYRQKREEALSKLALRMASRARKTGKKVTLEPMNPYERRVLHSALQNNPYVTTHSEGEEPYRRVVITLRQDAE